MKAATADRTGFYIILALVAAFFGLMTFWAPVAIDDIMFNICYREANGGSDAFSLRAFVDMAMEIRKADNCRLSNILDPLFTMMSPWKEIFPWLNGLLCAGIFWLIIKKIADVRRHLTIATALLWIAIVVFLPWRNMMFITDYSLNYVFPSFLTLLLVYLVTRSDIRTWTPALTAAIILLAIPTAAWHEGFFAATICGFGVWAILRRFRLRWQWWLTMVVYTAVALLFALSPGILQRTVREVTVEPRELPLWHIGLDLLPCVLIVILIGVTAFGRKGRELLCHLAANEKFVVFFVAAVAGTLLSVVVTHRPRTSFWPNLCAISAFMIYAVEFIRLRGENRCRGLLRIAGIGAVCAVIVCITHGVYSMVWQYRFYCENEYIDSQIENGVNEIYIDRLHPVSPRVLTLAFPNSYKWMNFQYDVMDDSLRGRHIAVLPTALRNIRSENTDTLDGELGIMRTGNALWTNEKSLPELKELNLILTLSDGSRTFINYGLARRFPTGAGDSATYVEIGRIDPTTVTAVDLP